MYISSGTWSLVGIENSVPVTTEEALKANLTNEGGVAGTYRILKNIMGLWMIQSVRRELNGQYSFGELSAMAREFGEPNCRVNVNDDAFLAPESMIQAIKEASGNISKIVEIAALAGDDLTIYSGNDDQIVPIMACGGQKMRG